MEEAEAVAESYVPPLEARSHSCSLEVPHPHATSPVLVDARTSYRWSLSQGMSPFTAPDSRSMSLHDAIGRRLAGSFSVTTQSSLLIHTRKMTALSRTTGHNEEQNPSQARVPMHIGLQDTNYPPSTSSSPHNMIKALSSWTPRSSKIHRPSLFKDSASQNPEAQPQSVDGAEPVDGLESQFPIHARLSSISSSLAAAQIVTEAAASGAAYLLSTTLASLLFALIYLPFTFAILFQSIVHLKPVIPKDWQTTLAARFWYISFALFAFMFSLPFVMIYGLLTDNGMWSLISNKIDKAIPFTIVFAIFLFILISLHFATLSYAFMRPDLRTIHSTRHSLEFRWEHFLSLGAVIFEMMQLSTPWLKPAALGLDVVTNGNSTMTESQVLDVNWLDGTHSVFRISQFNISSLNTALASFWIVFALVSCYAFSLGFGIAIDMPTQHWMGPILFELLPGLLYLTIVTRLFSVFDCVQTNTGIYVMNEDNAMECWNNSTHHRMAVAALMALLFYSCSALFVASYRGDASGASAAVKWKPTFLILERTLRDLFAITTILISDQVLSRALSFPILAMLALSTWHMAPCSITTLTRLKLLGHCCSIWCLINSFLPGIFIQQAEALDLQIVRTIVFGWLVLFVIWLIIEIVCLRGMRLETMRLAADNSHTSFTHSKPPDRIEFELACSPRSVPSLDVDVPLCSAAPPVVIASPPCAADAMIVAYRASTSQQSNLVRAIEIAPHSPTITPRSQLPASSE